MASVEQALALLAENARLMDAETVPLADAGGRLLAEPVVARVSQPPAAVSAMDGYAVRFADMSLGAKLKVTGESRAGKPSGESVAKGEAIRIFTGAYVPSGADHVLIQEDTRRDGDTVEVTFAQASPANIRRKGRDFSEGDTLVPAGHVLTPGAISLAAAANAPRLTVRKRPAVAILANGDELVEPGADLAPGQVVNSIAPALMEKLPRWGAAPSFLGVARDDVADVRARIAPPADLILTIGGASVGDYDVVRRAFAEDGWETVFEKIAVKPGKPTWFARKGERLALGLPGNPAAAMVTARLFLRPLLDAMLGAVRPAGTSRARLTRPLSATSDRAEYLRAVLAISPDGAAQVTPAEDQDSSLLSPFLTANTLIRRPAKSTAAAAGDLVDIVDYD